MVVIRLSRSGSKQKPYFNVVVQDSHKRRDGRFIERIGFYNPMANDGAETLRLNLERITYWQSKGAQLSETVGRIVKLNAKGADGLAAMKKKDQAKADAKKAKKLAAAEAEAKAAAAEAAPAEEAPAAEAAPAEEAPAAEAAPAEEAPAAEAAPAEEAPAA
ncbi:MAG: 30S ribosomal protein S16, partial [Methylophilaceae bacterium]|nr:30S ribosomal protein S16 [Methylophilaceae bacterium]MBL6726815.1 30S ribosomal protein S16 [Methylophilaceae bacterium]MBL6791335.1 30S ribosomal protein S16 [Methylophilaceae bacterium]